MKINSIDLSRLTNEDAFGFMNEVARQLKDACKTQPDAAKAFVDALSAYNEVLKGDSDLLTGAEISDADAAADNSWRFFNQYLSAMTHHPETDVREAAEAVNAVFSKYENPTSKSYATEYGIMERLLEELHNISAEIVIKAGAKAWMDDLDAKCKNFTSMYALRVQEKAGKVVGAVKTAKTDAIAAYREMIKVINALLVITPSAELETFATNINTLIEQKRIVLKASKTRSNNTKNSINEIDE